MKRVFLFCEVLTIFAFVVSGTLLAKDQSSPTMVSIQSTALSQNSISNKNLKTKQMMEHRNSAKEIMALRIDNAKKAANDLTPTRVQMRDQMSKTCSLQSPEGTALYWYGNQFSGGTYWAGTNGNAVIFNNGTDLSFANATDVNHPTVVDQVLLDFVYKGVFVGDTAYLLESQAIDIWDVSHPENPANLNWWLDCDAAYNTYAWYYDIVVRGDYAYLASDTDGLRICDVVNGTFKTPTASAGKSYYQVILNGNYLLAYDGSNIDVYDLTKPLEPVMVNSIMLAGYDQLIYSAPYLFAINYSNSATSQLDIYSWLDPVTGTISGPLNPPFRLFDPFFSIENINYAVKDGDYIYFSGNYGAYVVNVSNATAPTLYKFIADNYLQGGASDGKNHQDTFGTWIDSANGVHILADCQGIISFDLTPAIKGRYIATSALMGWYYKDAFSVNSDGSRFLANAYCEGVVLLDSDLVRLDFWELPNYYSYAMSSNFSLDGNMAFVCWEDYTSTTGNAGNSGVAILDISNDQMTLIKNYIPDYLTHDWVPFYAVPYNVGGGNYLLIAEYQRSTGQQRLELVDVTSPSNPLSVSIPIAGGVYGDIQKPAIAEGYTSGKIYAIVPLGTGGIISVDITTPASPIINPAGALSMNGNYAYEVAILNISNNWFGFAAVDDSSHGIYVIDLADPFNMILNGYSENIGSGHWQVCLAPGGSPAPQIVAAEKWSYYGDLYDASSPASPKRLSYFYDYGAYFGWATSQVLAVPNGSNSMLYTTSYIGATQYLNTPDYTKPQVTGPFTITPTPSGTPPVIENPVQLIVTGVSDDVGVTKVRFYAEDTCCNLYKLGDVVSPQADGTTYVFEFDPSHSPITGEVYLYARAYDAGNNATFYPPRYCFAGVAAIIPQIIVINLNPDYLPDGQFRTIYNQTITASGGTAPYTFSITEGSLPSGYTLNSTTGVIYGMTMNYGVYNFRVTATDANGLTGYRDYTIKVCPNITISPASLPSGSSGIYYEQTLTAGGGNAPYTYSLTSGSLPSGLTLNSTGVLSGTPTVVGNYVFTVSTTDSNGCSGTRNYSLTINITTQQPPPEIAPGNIFSNALIFSEDKNVISWPAEPSSIGYRLYRGTLATLPYLQNANVDSCKRYDGQQTSVDVDTDDPSTESGFLYFYLVTGYNQGGEGPAGNSRILNSSGNCSGSQEFNPQWQGVHSLSPKDMYWSGSCSYNGKIYLFGGNENAGETNTTYIYDVATDEWSQGASMPTGRYLCSASEVNGKIYVMGGRQLTASTNPVNVNECYDPATNTWETKTAMPNAIRGHSAVSANGKVYVLGGNTGAYTDAVRIYDPSTNSWSSGPTMPVKAGYGGAVYSSSTNSIYWVGGVKSSTASESNYIGKVYTLNLSSNTWDSGVSMPYKTAYFGIATDTSKIYIVGGTYWDTSSSQDISFPATMVFNIPSGNFDAGVIQYPSPLSRAYCVANFINGKLFVMQGDGNRLVDEYNPSTQQWYEPNSPINNGAGKIELTGAFGSAINGELYVVGGAGSDINPYVYKYNPSENQWSVKTGTDSNPTFYCTGGVWNNKLVIYGGFDLSQNPVSQAKIYDPIADTFTPIGGTNPNHANFATGVVLNDKLYLFGGDNGGSLVNKLSILNLASGQWSSGANLPIAMENISAVAYNGKIYLFGGYDGIDPDYLNNITYIYDPLTNSFSTGQSLPIPVYGAKSFVYGNKIVVDSGYNLWYNDTLGGLSGGLKASMQVYDPQINSFVGTFPRPFGKTNHLSEIIGTKYYSVMGEDDRYPVSRLDIAQCD